MAKKKNRILVGICGGIAIYKACELVRLLKKNGYEVICLMTQEARRLIQPELFSYLSENRVYSEVFADNESYEANHIKLAQWADKMVIIPATAHMLAKLRAGLCDDVVSLTVLSLSAKILICPAMHEEMYKKKITQENIAELKKRGYKFSGPVKGALLNQKSAMGHLQDINSIFKSITRL